MKISFPPFVFNRATLWKFAFYVAAGICLPIAIINHWAAFWQRSLPVQMVFVLFTSLLAAWVFYKVLKFALPVYNRLALDWKIGALAASIFTAVLVISIVKPYIFQYPFAIQYQHKLIITATGNKNPLSTSNIVQLVEVKINDRVIPNYMLVQSGHWILGPGGLTAEGRAALIYVFSAGQIPGVEIFFNHGLSGGIVAVQLDDQTERLVDLYADEPGQRAVIFERYLTTWDRLLLFKLQWGAEGIILFILFLAIYSTAIRNLHRFYQLLDDARSLIVALILVVLLFTGGTLLAFYQFNTYFGLQKISGSGKYFLGMEGAIKAYGPVISYGEGTGDRSDVKYCLEILDKVPGPDKVLNLNGFAQIEPCLFSPLLPRDKIVHHYEAVTITAPYYRTLMFAEPETVYPLYRKLGINYFYIRKKDTLFVNLGFSRALEPAFLGQYFDVAAESGDFYILTWRGNGRYPMGKLLEDEITDLYKQSQDPLTNPQYIWWKGRTMLTDWIQVQEWMNN